MVTHEPSTSDAVSTTPETVRSQGRDPAPSTDLDAVFDALSHPRRRYVLSTLADRDGDQSLSRLATDVAAWETDQSLEAVSADARERCAVALHHVHLPKLDDLGLLDYDPDGDPAVTAADATGVRAVLEGLGGRLDAAQEPPRDRDGV